MPYLAMCPLLQDLVEVYLIFVNPLNSFTLPRHNLQPQKILISFWKKKTCQKEKQLLEVLPNSCHLLRFPSCTGLYFTTTGKYWK